MTLHRREVLQQTTLSGGGLDFYAQKNVVLRTRKRPSQQWIYTDDTVQRISIAQELGKAGISLEGAAAALKGATMDEIRGALATHRQDALGEWVNSIITRSEAVPEPEAEEAAPVAV